MREPYGQGASLQPIIGLVPKQTGTGGKVQLLGISKRGDTYLRALFIHGARSATLLAKEPLPLGYGADEKVADQRSGGRDGQQDSAYGVGFGGP